MLSLYNAQNKKDNWKLVSVLLLSVISILVILFSIVKPDADIESLILSIKIIFIFVIILIISYQLIISRNSVLVFLLISFITLLLGELIDTILRGELVTRDATTFMIEMTGSTILLMTSLFFFLLFVESFTSEKLMTKQNIAILVLLSIISTGLFFSATFTLFQNDQNTTNITSSQYNSVLNSSRDASISSTAKIIDQALYVFIISGFILIVTLILLVLKTINRRIKDTKNKHSLKLLKQIRISSLLMMFGPVIPFVLMIILEDESNPLLVLISSSFISTIGLAVSFYVYYKGGFFMLQDESLKRLIVMNNSGIPVYSYKFREFEETNYNSTQDDDMEILFSGALTSISLLLTEFTGANRKVEVIQLDNFNMILSQTSNHTVILMTEKSTLFNRGALDQFNLAAANILSSIPRGMALNTDKIKEVNQIVESSFGFGNLQQIQSL